MRLHFYLFGLSGHVKKWDEHNRLLALFVQKTQLGVDGFKLHNMVADIKKEIRLHRKNCVIHMILPMQPEFVVSACSLKRSTPNNNVIFLFITMFNGWKIYSTKVCHEAIPILYTFLIFRKCWVKWPKKNFYKKKMLT